MGDEGEEQVCSNLQIVELCRDTGLWDDFTRIYEPYFGSCSGLVEKSRSIYKAKGEPIYLYSVGTYPNSWSDRDLRGKNRWRVTSFVNTSEKKCRRDDGNIYQVDFASGGEPFEEVVDTLACWNDRGSDTSGYKASSITIRCNEFDDLANVINSNNENNNNNNNNNNNDNLTGNQQDQLNNNDNNDNAGDDDDDDGGLSGGAMAVIIIIVVLVVISCCICIFLFFRIKRERERRQERKSKRSLRQADASERSRAKINRNNNPDVESQSFNDNNNNNNNNTKRNSKIANQSNHTDQTLDESSAPLPKSSQRSTGSANRIPKNSQRSTNSNPNRNRRPSNNNNNKKRRPSRNRPPSQVQAPDQNTHDENSPNVHSPPRQSVQAVRANFENNNDNDSPNNNNKKKNNKNLGPPMSPKRNLSKQDVDFAAEDPQVQVIQNDNGSITVHKKTKMKDGAVMKQVLSFQNEQEAAKNGYTLE